ncbi:MAG: Cdc6/Cdc18 family protein [Candidatus Nanohalobium sp.]
MIVEDARVLRDDFIPGEVVHRDSEVQELSRTFEPLIKGESAENCLLYGPPGTGKTCISRYVMDKLQEELIDLQYTYINCWENYNRFKVLYKALEGIGKTLQVHRQSTPTDELFQRLKNYKEKPYILILDEVDQLEDEKVLYDLQGLKNIYVVMIANTQESVFYNMDERVRSRLIDSKRIQFKAYTSSQLQDILMDRVEWGINSSAINSSLVKKIALSSEGDARIAIGILRSAAKRAQNQGKGQITRKIIQEAVPEAKTNNKEKNIEKLNKHQKKLYEIINKEEEIRPGDLYEEYREEISEKDAKSNRMLRKYLKKMDHYNLIKSEGEGRWRKYLSKQ